MSWLVYVWMAGAALGGAPAEPAQHLQRYDFTQPHMGVPFRLLFYAPDEATANRAAAAAFARIKQLNGILSDYDRQSELNRLARTSGSGRNVPVSDELWFCLQQAQALARRTDGAFDITVGPYVKLWRRARRTKQLPDAEQLAAARAAVGYQAIELDAAQKTCRLTKPEMRLDLGGIAKGYAAQEALCVLAANGVTRALVDGSGDIALGKPPPDREGWRVGIAPLEPGAPPSCFLVLKQLAVATSGDAWQHIEIAGVRYSHIIDPKTGLGLTRRSSVTVVAPTGAMADALASAVTVLGPERGLELIEKTPCTAALVVIAGDGGKARRYESKRFRELVQAE